MPVWRALCFLASGEGASPFTQAFSRGPMGRLGKSIAKQSASTLRRKREGGAKYKQKSRGCHKTFTAATGVLKVRFVVVPRTQPDLLVRVRLFSLLRECILRQFARRRRPALRR